MNITILRPLAARAPATAQAVQLARKLETATTGKFPQRPRAVFLAQACFIHDNPELAHSIAASINAILEAH